MGVDTARYGSGSTRAAATSKVLAEGAPLDMILSSGGWTRPSTFQRFYARPVGGRVLAEYVIQSYVLDIKQSKLGARPIHLFDVCIMLVKC